MSEPVEPAAETPEPEVPAPAPQPHKRMSKLARVAAIMASIGWLFIALGEFSDATFLLNELRIEIIKRVTNSYEYDVIGKIHVGNTMDFIEGLVGKPQVSRDLGDGLSSNYFFTDKYLLTLIYKEGRVEAFTVLALEEGFAPEVPGLGGEMTALGSFAYAVLPLRPEIYAVDDSRVLSDYLEAIETELPGRFVDLYLGTIAYGIGGTGPEVERLARATVSGSEEQVRAARANLRRKLHPNLFGRGEVALEVIEKSLLSTSEYADYSSSQ